MQQEVRQAWVGVTTRRRALLDSSIKLPSQLKKILAASYLAPCFNSSLRNGPRLTRSWAWVTYNNFNAMHSDFMALQDCTLGAPPSLLSASAHQAFAQVANLASAHHPASVVVSLVAESSPLLPQTLAAAQAVTAGLTPQATAKRFLLP